VTIYDASSNTVYRATLPDGSKDATRPQRHDGEKLTLAKIQRVLDRLAETWTVSGAEPGTAAGRPAYTVKISPQGDGGLLGAVQVAWDAVRGAPLRAAVYARGEADPVLELAATEVSYDAVPDSAIDVAPPAGAKVDDLTSGGDRARGHARRRPAADAATRSVPAVRRALGFDLAAPETLAGLPRRAVRLVTLDAKPAALAIYGKGRGAIGVLQRAAGTSDGAPRHRDGDRSLRLPQIDVDGSPATELATPLGTIVTFERDGVAYVVAGSVPRDAAEKVARALP
jgi:hypothetical protein